MPYLTGASYTLRSMCLSIFIVTGFILNAHRCSSGSESRHSIVPCTFSLENEAREDLSITTLSTVGAIFGSKHSCAQAIAFPLPLAFTLLIRHPAIWYLPVTFSASQVLMDFYGWKCLSCLQNVKSTSANYGERELQIKWIALIAWRSFTPPNHD